MCVLANGGKHRSKPNARYTLGYDRMESGECAVRTTCAFSSLTGCKLPSAFSSSFVASSRRLVRKKQYAFSIEQPLPDGAAKRNGQQQQQEASSARQTTPALQEGCQAARDAYIY